MDLFQWRTAVVSEAGPASPITRHVLLTLSLHMDKAGGSCFPSTRTLAAETALSRRAVEMHLATAEAAGWIRRTERRGTGQGWRRMAYTARLPQNVVKDVPHEGGAPRSPRTPKGGAPDSPRRAEGGEPHAQKVAHHVPLSTSVNSPEEGAVIAFCRMTGSAWNLKQPLAEWAASLKADYPGIHVAYEVKKAAEYHQAERTNVKSPSLTLRRWLDRVKPSRNGTTHPDNGMRITPAELRNRYGIP
jgi:DNA-binding transcriptional MocR family regulator